MKTLKFFLTFFVVMTFFTLTSYSQRNVKTTTYYGYDLVNVQLPGLTETVTGSYGGYWTVWNFKTQWRAKGTYTGDISGTIYYTSAIENYNDMTWMPGSVETGVGTIRIEDEYGTVYYTYHYISHITINANGEIASDVYKEQIFLLN
ncbi:MAG: hypothetical protein WCE64_01830 [Bacteroidales bacterium]